MIKIVKIRVAKPDWFLNNLIKALLVAAIIICSYPYLVRAQQLTGTKGAPNSTSDSAKKANRIADSAFVRQHYRKLETMVRMRDGIRLFTSIYIPRDSSKLYPIMLNRTPYNVEPYGPDAYLKKLGPSRLFTSEEFIFVYQDVRGRYMSEGEFVAVRPYIANKKSGKDIDETTDAYDTIDWLIKHLPCNNGKVGVWGISADGFYASCSAIDAHPALKAVSPQAPVTNWFMGDDRHHNGVFQEQGSFAYLSSFGAKRPEPTTQTPPKFANYGTTDGYQFYLKMGPLKSFDDQVLHHDNSIWNDLMRHGTYDEFWQSRTPEPHLKNIRPAMLVVGGFFDQEDLYGALKTHLAIEKGGHQQRDILVMGPWVHGGFSRFDGDSIAGIKFSSKTGVFYRENIEFPFFMHYLKGAPDPQLPNAIVFESGSNKWRKYNSWPTSKAFPAKIYIQGHHKLSFNKPMASRPNFDQFVSDPANPVPYTSKVEIERGSNFMVEDQRFVSKRQDVLTYQTDVLKENVALAGPLKADLFVSTSGTDADFVVKVIDVYPTNSASNQQDKPAKMNGYQMLVRGEIMRSKFRKSFSRPTPMTPGKITEVKWDMEDVNYCFLKGHRIMIQIQSTWFPLNDRNPQTFTDIYNADQSVFQKATQHVYFSSPYSSHLEVFIKKISDNNTEM